MISSISLIVPAVTRDPTWPDGTASDAPGGYLSEPVVFDEPRRQLLVGGLISNFPQFLLAVDFEHNFRLPKGLPGNQLIRVVLFSVLVGFDDWGYSGYKHTCVAHLGRHLAGLHF